jgi:hypothetical protein
LSFPSAQLRSSLTKDRSMDGGSELDFVVQKLNF